MKLVDDETLRELRHDMTKINGEKTPWYYHCFPARYAPDIFLSMVEEIQSLRDAKTMNFVENK